MIIVAPALVTEVLLEGVISVVVPATAVVVPAAVVVVVADAEVFVVVVVEVGVVRVCLKSNSSCKIAFEGT